ncbi:uncharacterized protein METZ01_LOCUS224608, partial [marine metagenome]
MPAAEEQDMPEEVYKKAGVDREAAGSAKDRIFKLARSTFTPGVLGDIGAFGALYQVVGYKDPVLVAHTDGVGTKLRIASLMSRYDTVGEDIVNHTTNDILTCGAKPLFFLDYMGMDSLAPEKVESLVSGMAKACKALGCALIGGETAEMPGMYIGDDVELVGFVVGAVERDAVIDGSSITAGDVLLGLRSDGLHTNGYSLVRRIFGIDDDPSILEEHTADLGVTLGDALLVPHRSYTAELTPVLDRIKGMAHITGGGLTDNVPRMLPVGLAAHLNSTAWEIPALFQLLQQKGKIGTEEMNRVFNMGIGMIVAVD